MKSSIALLEGGYTDEHVVSTMSADTIYNAVDKNKFNVYRVKILKESWTVLVDGKTVAIDKSNFSFVRDGKKVHFDVAFNMIHGTPGEDGILQGYFDLLGIPYTGGDVLNMALTFNKKTTTAFLGHKGYDVAKSIVYRNKNEILLNEISSKLTLPIFVKPNTAGSSLGISKVNKWEDVEQAIDKAFEQSKEILVEEMVMGTEVTCGVISYKGEIVPLPVTEIVSFNDFFDYDAKYIANSTQEITPARIEKEMYQLIQQISKQIYFDLNCKGFIRIDYIIESQRPYIIEVNSIPGMSSRSLIPQQLQHANISLPDLINDMINDLLPVVGQKAN